MKNHWLMLHKDKKAIKAHLEFIGEFQTSLVVISADQTRPGVTVESIDPKIIQWIKTPFAAAYSSHYKHRPFDGLIEIFQKGVLVESWYLHSIVVTHNNYDYSLNKCSMTFTCSNHPTIKSQFIKF